MHGLGLSLWTGEDVPEMVAETPKAEPTLITLELGTDNWDNVVKYITANKSLGVTKIGQQLTRKYKITPAVKKEITALCNQ
jgi:hypothetical protein